MLLPPTPRFAVAFRPPITSTTRGKNGNAPHQPPSKSGRNGNAHHRCHGRENRHATRKPAISATSLFRHIALSLLPRNFIPLRFLRVEICSASAQLRLTPRTSALLRTSPSHS